MNWKHFTIDELTKSETAKRLGIDNTPDNETVSNLDELVTNVLDRLREDWGSPIRVTSGYRSPKLNKAVGGVKNSQHIEGKAADIQPIGKDFDDFVRFIRQWAKRNEFDKCIIEKSGTSRWIHISYNKGNNRNKLFQMTVK